MEDIRADVKPEEGGFKFIVEASQEARTVGPRLVVHLGPSSLVYTLEDPKSGETIFELGRPIEEEDELYERARDLLAMKPAGNITFTGEEATELAKRLFETCWAIHWRALAGAELFDRSWRNPEAIRLWWEELDLSDPVRKLLALGISVVHPAWFSEEGAPKLRGSIYFEVRPEGAEAAEDEVWETFRQSELTLQDLQGILNNEPDEAVVEMWFEEVGELLGQVLKRARWRERKRYQRHEQDQVRLDSMIYLGEGDVSLHEVVADPEAPDPLALVEAEEEEKEDRQSKLDELLTSLTRREREVAELLVDGRSQKTIAEILRITPGRISQIVTSIRRKLLLSE